MGVKISILVLTDKDVIYGWDRMVNILQRMNIGTSKMILSEKVSLTLTIIGHAIKLEIAIIELTLTLVNGIQPQTNALEMHSLLYQI